MECKKFKDLIIPYIYNELTLKKKNRVDEHISKCSECKSTIKDFENILGLVQQKEIIEPPSYIDSKIMARARQSTSFKHKIAFRRKPLKPLYPSWGLAVALIGVIMVIWHISPNINTIFTPHILQNANNQELDRLKKNKIGITGKYPDIDLSTSLSPETAAAIPVLVESDEEKTEIKQDITFEDAYNKHPYGPYDDNSFRFHRVPSGADFAAFQHQRGIEYKNQGRCQDANYIFQKIINEYPKYQKIKSVYIDSADCYSKLGKKYDAVTQLQMYLERFPHEKEVIQKLIEKIEQNN